MSKRHYKTYIRDESAEVIAQQLRADSSLSNGDLDQLPSLLALYLPRIPEGRSRDIAACLFPGADRSVRELRYKNMMKSTKKAIQRSPTTSLSYEESNGHTSRRLIGDDTANLSAEGTWEAYREYVAAKPGRVAGPSSYCYMCRMWIKQAHEEYPRMCGPCGNLNKARGELSHPPNLNLDGKVALVTGGRINLGFHTALRMLRCGAIVIVSTRYPEDAVTRYENESDSSVWKDRLKVIGADFRSAPDAFQLVEQVRNLVGQMGGVLHILINNAAQTLTDSLEKEQNAVAREKLLQGQGSEKPMLITHSYYPRVRGVADQQSIEPSAGIGATEPGVGGAQVLLKNDASALGSQRTDLNLSPAAEGEDGPSSWVQSLADIPYEDVISAHSVNTFVPLILIRELMPLMQSKQPSGHRSAAASYIVNVSLSRESVLEKKANSPAKDGKRVHAHMPKAGLNVITETEAYQAWHEGRVAMNTVDPGYIGAPPEFEQAHGGKRPLEWEDGAGRVLWLIAISEKGQSGRPSNSVWGRFLKHHGDVDVWV